MIRVLAILALWIVAASAHAIGFSYAPGADLYLRFKPGNVEVDLPATADASWYEATTLTGVADGTYTVIVMVGNPGDSSVNNVGVVPTPVFVVSQAEVATAPLTPTLATVLSKLNTMLASASGGNFKFTEPALQEAPSAAGDGQPRINEPPGKAFVFEISDRNDGTYGAVKNLRLPPGTVHDLPIGVKMDNLFGPNVRVANVATPVVSGGAATAEAMGPHDTMAMVMIGGTVTAGELETITFDVTMRTGDRVPVVVTLEGLQ